jgi:hypothetical protein
MDVRRRKVDDVLGLTGRGMGMQVIARKDAEIEDIKKRLAEAEKQLAEDQKVRMLAGRVQTWE